MRISQGKIGLTIPGVLLGGCISGYSQHKVAITFDDLLIGGGKLSFDLMKAVNERIIDDCKTYGVSAVGFVKRNYTLRINGQTIT